MPLHNEPFVVGDELLIFFNAFSRHQEQPCAFGTRSIGVARLRRDGFAGLTAADNRPGTFRTRPIVVGGNQLLVNVEQRGAPGQVQIALQDTDGNELPGFGWADCVPITDDAVRARVTWKGKTDLQTLKGETVRVAARLQGGAILYALAFGP